MHGLFGSAGVAAVVARPDGLTVEGMSGSEAGAAREAACRLFEALAASGSDGGVLEEVSPVRGFAAATPILAEGGRCLGALCLVDEARRTLLSGLQRRLFAEIGRLLAPALGGEAGELLLRLADAEVDAVALFDPDGRCLLRNRMFDSLLGMRRAATAGAVPLREVLGREAEWLARHLMREQPPVGVYRAALSGDAWLHVEERRGPLGGSLVARVESGVGIDGPEDRLLFERCPSPMFVFDRGTGAILAANDAALALYGWERDAFLKLDLDGVGPVGRGEGRWTHRARDGRELPVTGRTADIELRGRSAVLVMLSRAPAA